MGVEQIAAQARRAALSIHVRDGDKITLAPIGSAFLAGQGVGAAKPIVAVTCAHVVAKLGPDRLAVGVLTTNETVAFLPVANVRAFVEFDAAVLGLFNTPIGGTEKIPLGNIMMAADRLAGGNSVKEGRGLLVVGYPLQSGVEVLPSPNGATITNVPIVRVAIVARRAIANRFLIDGTISPGNSGSMVFDLQEEKVIGMVSGYRPDSIVLNDVEGRQVAALPYNSGLGVVVTMEPILNLLRDQGVID